MVRNGVVMICVRRVCAIRINKINIRIEFLNFFEAIVAIFGVPPVAYKMSFK